MTFRNIFLCHSLLLLLLRRPAVLTIMIGVALKADTEPQLISSRKRQIVMKTVMDFYEQKKIGYKD